MELVDELAVELIGKFSEGCFPSEHIRDQIVLAYMYAEEMVAYRESKAEQQREPPKRVCPKCNVEYVSKPILTLDGGSIYTYCPVCGGRPENMEGASIDVQTEVPAEDRTQGADRKAEDD